MLAWIVGGGRPFRAGMCRSGTRASTREPARGVLLRHAAGEPRHATVTAPAVRTIDRGAMDLNQPIGNGIGYWRGGEIYQYTKGKSQCVLTVRGLGFTSGAPEASTVIAAR